MNMTIPAAWPLVDIILLLFLAGFVFYGLFFGLIKTVGSLAGVVVGSWVASHFYLNIFAFAGSLAFGHDEVGKVVTFFVVFTLTNRLVCLAFALLDKTFHFFAIVPFLKTINRLGGAAFGFLEGGLIAGLALYVISRYVPEGFWLVGQLKGSQLAPFFLHFVNILVPLLPDILQRLKAVI